MKGKGGLWSGEAVLIGEPEEDEEKEEEEEEDAKTIYTCTVSNVT